jgi:pyruvate formate lyase activating enzyme
MDLVDVGTVFDIQRYSIHDGPGIRTVVFLKGCPLACRWCHNPEGQSTAPEVMLYAERCHHCGACVAVCPNGLAGQCTGCGRCVAACRYGARRLAGRPMGVVDVLSEVERDTAFFDESGGGVTFSGGEPLAQPAFLASLLRACRRHELRTAVETSGLTSAATLSALAEDVGLWLFDLKLMADARHRAATGVSNEQILANLTALAARGAQVVVRVPLIPGINDDDANIDATGAFVAGLPGSRALHLLPYHDAGSAKYGRLGRDYSLNETKRPEAAALERIADRLRAYGLSVTTGGAAE